MAELLDLLCAVAGGDGDAKSGGVPWDGGVADGRCNQLVLLAEILHELDSFS